MATTTTFTTAKDLYFDGLKVKPAKPNPKKDKSDDDVNNKDKPSCLSQDFTTNATNATNATDATTTKAEKEEAGTKSKYSIATEQGLCFHCFYSGYDVQRRPRSPLDAFCPTCMSEMDIAG